MVVMEVRQAEVPGKESPVVKQDWIQGPSSCLHLFLRLIAIFVLLLTPKRMAEH